MKPNHNTYAPDLGRRVLGRPCLPSRLKSMGPDVVTRSVEQCDTILRGPLCVVTFKVVLPESIARIGIYCSRLSLSLSCCCPLAGGGAVELTLLPTPPRAAALPHASFLFGTNICCIHVSPPYHPLIYSRAAHLLALGRDHGRSREPCSTRRRRVEPDHTARARRHSNHRSVGLSRGRGSNPPAWSRRSRGPTA